MKILLSLCLAAFLVIQLKAQNHVGFLQAQPSMVSVISPTPLSGNSAYNLNLFVNNQAFPGQGSCLVNPSGLITELVFILPNQDTMLFSTLRYDRDTIPRRIFSKSSNSLEYYSSIETFDVNGGFESEQVVDSFGNTWLNSTNTLLPGGIYSGVSYKSNQPLGGRPDTLIKTRIVNQLGLPIYDSAHSFSRGPSGYSNRRVTDFYYGTTGILTHFISKATALGFGSTGIDSTVFQWLNDTIIISTYSRFSLLTPFQINRVDKLYPAVPLKEIFNKNLEFDFGNGLTDNITNITGKNYYKNSIFTYQQFGAKTIIEKKWTLNPSNQTRTSKIEAKNFITGRLSGRIDSLISEYSEVVEYTPVIQGVDKRFEFQTTIAYPNPSTGLLLFKELEPGSRFALSNTQGKEVFSGVWTGEPLELSNLPSGIYTLTTASQTEPPKRSKWVKQ